MTREQDIKKVAKALLDYTISVVGPYFPPEPSASKGKELDTKGKEVVDRIRNISVTFSQQVAIARLMEALLDQPIAREFNKKNKSRANGIGRDLTVQLGYLFNYTGLLLVPTGNSSNKHNYPLGRPCLMAQSDRRAITMKGELGNFLTSQTGELRLPTPEEAIEFVTKNYTISFAILAMVKANTEKANLITPPK